MDLEKKTLKKLLQSIGVKVPNSVVKRLLDTPVGTTLRGLSDALDSLNIDNDVYQLPPEYLKELDYPYVMVLPHREDAFAVVENEENRIKAMPEWKGVVLVARKTSETFIYKNVWLRNAVGYIIDNQMYLIIATLLFLFIVFAWPGLRVVCHSVMSALGIWVSTILLRRDYGGDILEKYCKIGKVVDCEQVLSSKGSLLFGLFRMSDLAFLFFSTQLFFALIANSDLLGYAFLLLLVGCCFTLYSVIYQIAVIRKICLYCMAINLMVWIDTIMFAFNRITINLQTPFVLILSGVVAYVTWYIVIHYLSVASQNESFKHRDSALYNKELFDWLLSKERPIEEVDDKYADVGGVGEDNIITLFVHPGCKKCKRVYKYIPELRKVAKVKTVSLASNDIDLNEYCRKNHIDKTPTIVFNGRELPELYSVENLKYVL